MFTVQVDKLAPRGSGMSLVTGNIIAVTRIAALDLMPPPQLSLKHFILQARARNLYRQALRAARRKLSL